MSRRCHGSRPRRQPRASLCCFGWLTSLAALWAILEVLSAPPEPEPLLGWLGPGGSRAASAGRCQRSRGRTQCAAGATSGVLLPGYDELDTLRREGKVKEILSVFERLKVSWPEDSQNVLYNLVLGAHVRIGNFSGAASWYSRMRERGLGMPDRAFRSLVKGAARHGKLGSWLRESERAGLRLNGAKCAAVVSGFAAMGQAPQAAAWLRRAQAADAAVDVGSFVDVIAAFARLGDDVGAARWLGELLRAGLEPPRSAFQALLQVCARRGNTTGAAFWFRSMQERGLQAAAPEYEAMIRCHTQNGDAEEARKWLEEMQDADLPPSADTYSSFIILHARDDNVEQAFKWLVAARSAQVVPDEAAADELALALLERGDLETAERVLAVLDSCGGRASLPTYGALMIASGVVGDVEQVFRWLEASRKAKLGLDGDTHNSLVFALISAGDIDRALQWLGRTRSAGYRPSHETLSALVEFYSEQPDLQTALRFMEELLTLDDRPGASTYASLIQCCADTRPVRADEAERLYCEMMARSPPWDSEEEDPFGRAAESLREALGDKRYFAVVDRVGMQLAGTRKPEQDQPGLEDEEERRARMERKQADEFRHFQTGLENIGPQYIAAQRARARGSHGRGANAARFHALKKIARFKKKHTRKKDRIGPSGWDGMGYKT